MSTIASRTTRSHSSIPRHALAAALLAGFALASGNARAQASAPAPATGDAPAAEPAPPPSGYPPPPPRAYPPPPYYGAYRRPPRRYGYSTLVPEGVYRP